MRFRRPGFALLALPACLLAAQEPDPRYTDVRVALVPQAEGIVIDGRCDDPGWRTAVWSEGFVLFGKSGAPVAGTRFAAARVGDRLVFAVRCDEPLKVLSHDLQERDSMTVFADDHVELFIDPHHDHRHYQHVAVNVSGSIYDEQDKDRGWNCDFRSAVATYAGGWSVEISLAMADLGIRPGEDGVLGFNVCRWRNLGGEAAEWSKTIGGFHDPVRFGHLVFGDVDTVIASEERLRLDERFGRIVLDGPPESSLRVSAACSRSSGERLIAAVAAVPAPTQTGKLSAFLAASRADAERLASARSHGAEVVEAERAVITRLDGFDESVWSCRVSDLLDRASAPGR